MLLPSTFSSLSSLLWDWRLSLGNDLSNPSDIPAGASATAPKTRRRTLIQKLLNRNVRLNIRKDTTVLPVNVPPKPLPESWFNDLRPRPISALIIGINDYQHLPKLRGAANDADTFSNYLQNDLKVPTDCIVNLRNQEATRAGILKALNALSLRSARHPRKEDSIIIYFSGYGGPLDTSIKGVQTIVPWDYSAVAGNEIPAVTSSELLSLLAEIKRNKGDNITIIFDCGGSSQKAQNDKDGLISSRVIDLALGEGGHRAGSVSSEDTILSGNVFILSACSRGEAAREVRGHGLFTSALIRQLKRQGPMNTTRSNVLARLPQIPNQTPQAYGGITDSPLFDIALVPPEQIAYNISEDKQKYIVHPESVAGITPGAHFFVYRDDSRLSKKPKAIIADRVALFTTTLKLLIDLSIGKCRSPQSPCQSRPDDPFGLVNYHPRGPEQAPVKKDGGVPSIVPDNPGTPAYSYFIRDGQDLDVDFIKVLFSTEPVTLHSIPQATIFQDAALSGGGKQKVAESKTEMSNMTLVPGTWLPPAMWKFISTLKTFMDSNSPMRLSHRAVCSLTLHL